MVVSYSPPPCCSAKDQVLVQFRRSWSAQGVALAISSVPKPCGGACAVDLHKHFPVPALLTRFEGRRQQWLSCQHHPHRQKKSLPAHPRKSAILAARTTAGLSQNGLAAKLKTAQQNVQRLEKGGNIPSTNTLLRIAKATAHQLVITFSRVALPGPQLPRPDNHPRRPQTSRS